MSGPRAQEEEVGEGHDASQACIRATCLAVDGHGVLLCGDSGAGKSDLALRLIEGGACLVADDYTFVRREGARVLAWPPEPIAGLLEVRGVGILTFPVLRDVCIAAVIDLVSADDVPRLPAAETRMIADVPLRRFRIAAFESSAALKVRLAVRLATGGIMSK